MRRTPATSHSWNTNPMPPERKLLDLDLTLSAEEFRQVRLGFIPDAMEQKWFIYFEEGWLSFHRSWTGICIYRVQFGLTGEQYRVIEAWANRSPNEYKVTDDEYDRQMVKYLIDAALLGKDCDPPVLGQTWAKEP
jgi:hypothetical protein